MAALLANSVGTSTLAKFARIASGGIRSAFAASSNTRRTVPFRIRLIAPAPALNNNRRFLQKLLDCAQGSSCGKDTCMDFIERLFGIAPDGGNGSFELLLFLVPLAGIVLLRAWRSRGD